MNPVVITFRLHVVKSVQQDLSSGKRGFTRESNDTWGTQCGSVTICHRIIRIFLLQPHESVSCFLPLQEVHLAHPPDGGRLGRRGEGEEKAGVFCKLRERRPLLRRRRPSSDLEETLTHASTHTAGPSHELENKTKLCQTVELASKIMSRWLLLTLSRKKLFKNQQM